MLSGKPLPGPLSVRRGAERSREKSVQSFRDVRNPVWEHDRKTTAINATAIHDVGYRVSRTVTATELPRRSVGLDILRAHRNAALMRA